MKNKALQYFTDDYLESCKKMSHLQILTYLENFRLLHGASPAHKKSKLISLKVPEDLLNAFKQKAKLANTPYQTKIKSLMREWLD